MFDKLLEEFMNSKTSQKLVRLLNGVDAFCFDMVDKEQLDKCMEILQLGPSNKILDVGSGIGVLLEMIVGDTGASAVGIDIAKIVIDKANERVAAKGTSSRVSFRTGDINLLLDYFPPASFDTILSLDTLYFVYDIKQTILDFKTLLSRGGQMALFYSQQDSPANSTASDTLLGKALIHAGLLPDTHWHAFDFTESHLRYWRQTLKLANELKPEFEQEGTWKLGMQRVKEAEMVLKVFDQGIGKRFLYHVKV